MNREILEEIKKNQKLNNDEFFLYVNIFLFLKFVERLDILKKEGINRLNFYFKNLFNCFYSSDFNYNFLQKLISFTNFKNNFFIEAIFKSFEINPDYLQDVDKRKKVIFSIFISMFCCLKSYKEIVRLINKNAVLTPNLKEKIIKLAKADFNNFVELLNAKDFSTILESNYSNYILAIEKMSELVVKNEYHNYIKLRQKIRFGRKITNNFKNLKPITFIIGYEVLENNYERYKKSTIKNEYEAAFFNELPDFLEKIKDLSSDIENDK